MIYNIARNTGWKLWDDIKDGATIVLFIAAVFGIAGVIAGTFASYIITVYEYMVPGTYSACKLGYAHSGAIYLTLGWVCLWIGIRIRDGIMESRR